MTKQPKRIVSYMILLIGLMGAGPTYAETSKTHVMFSHEVTQYCARMAQSYLDYYIKHRGYALSADEQHGMLGAQFNECLARQGTTMHSDYYPLHYY